MLAQLRIKDFILIEEQEISLESGLNVLTGETGAGKSIILQAIQILLGAKSKPDLVRPGAEEAIVEGLFLLDKVPQNIKDELPDLLQGEELLISRSISSTNPRSRIYVNGRLSTQQMLESLRSRLVNICSQNQQVRLLDSKFHLETLDGYLAKPEIIHEYQELYRQYQTESSRLKSLEENLAGQSLRQAEMQEIVEELDGKTLKDGYREHLETELKKQQGAEKLIEISSQLLSELSSESALSVALRSFYYKVSELSKIDTEIGESVQAQFSEIKSILADMELQLSRYQSKIDINEERLEELRAELAELARLMRKYKRTEPQLAEMLQEAKTHLNSGMDSKAIEKVRKHVAAIEEDLNLKATHLSALRQKAAASLAKNVMQGLAELNLKGAQFEVAFSQKALSLDGIDSVDFRLSTNKGMALKALKDVASGGELSRVLLVLKQVLREVSGVNVLVFDEVDTGISGSVARAVGEKLKALSEYSQVLCITHLAQVASLADHHLIVKKKQDKLATTVVQTIKGETRVDEIARMISGHMITKAARDSARELLGS